MMIAHKKTTTKYRIKKWPLKKNLNESSKINGSLNIKIVPTSILR